jgi:hypothetical protein
MLTSTTENEMPMEQRKKQKQLTEKEDFMTSYDIIAKELVQDLSKYHLPQNGIDWLKKMFNETIPGGTHS